MTYFPAIFSFLDELRENNERPWFQANKQRYERDLKQPALEFIRDFEGPLHGLSPYFTAIPKAVGGSLFRIYRDVRYSKDKSPYKTHCGLHFRHEAAKDAHAPGFYLHIDPDESGMGLGIWGPDGGTLGRIRDHIVLDPAGWGQVREEVTAAGFELWGESLKRAPRGYPKDHEHVEDLRRKHLVLWAPLSRGEIEAEGFLQRFVDRCEAGLPLMRWLGRALELPV